MRRLIVPELIFLDAFPDERCRSSLMPFRPCLLGF
jgi:hypothetical protein